MKKMTFIAANALAVGYSHGRTETVLVEGADGPVRINESDFDEKTHKLFKGDIPLAPAAVDPTPAVPVAPAELLVMKSGRKFFITDIMGQKISGEAADALGIDEKGYDSEEAAKAVQTRAG